MNSLHLNRIGILCAMTLEAEAILARSEIISREETLRTVFTLVKIGEREAVVAVSGIGKVAAACTTQYLIDRYGVSAVINSGVAGGLIPGLDLGEIVIADALVQHDIDSTAVGDPYGYISALGLTSIQTDEALRSALASAATADGAKYRVGAIASGDQFIDNAERKAWIHDTFGAVSCEMEGAAVGYVCHMNGVPCAVIRAISDCGSAAEFEVFKHEAARASAAVILGMINARRKVINDE